MFIGIDKKHIYEPTSVLNCSLIKDMEIDFGAFLSGGLRQI